MSVCARMSVCKCVSVCMGTAVGVGAVSAAFRAAYLGNTLHSTLFTQAEIHALTMAHCVRVCVCVCAREQV